MDVESEISRIRDSLHATRKRQRIWGWVLSLFGLLTLADSAMPFPVPLVGLPSVIVGLAAVLGGGYVLLRQQDLPLPESLDVARLHQGYLSAPLLIRALHVTPGTAERILAELIQRGYMQVDAQALDDGEVSYRVQGLEAPPVHQTLPPSSPDSGGQARG